MSTSAKVRYHHGDLRETLVTTAMQMLEQGEAFSLRAVARRAGVSPTAPYRHFADRATLESALAAEGFRDLKADLLRDDTLPTSVSEFAEFGVAYVDFALRRPALFRLMFGSACDDANDDRVQAIAAIHELLVAAVMHVFPNADVPALATAGWSLVHGLACLHLEEKLVATSSTEVADRVRASFAAIFSPGTRTR